MSTEQTEAIQIVDQQIEATRAGYALAVQRLEELADALDDADGAAYAYKLRQAAGLLLAMSP